MTATTETDYLPGVCNINPSEIAYRRKWAVGGIVIAALIFIGLIFTNVHPVIRSAVIFLPLLVGILNALQVRNKFCVSYAASGMQNAAPNSTTASQVSADDHAADKRKASSMNRKALAATSILCIMLLIIPNFG